MIVKNSVAFVGCNPGPSVVTAEEEKEVEVEDKTKDAETSSSVGQKA